MREQKRKEAIQTKKDISVNVISYLTPKHALLTVVKAGIAKANLPPLDVFLLGFNAGAYIAFGCLCAIVAGGGLKNASHTGIGDINPGLSSLVGAAVFPFGLILVVLGGGELFTGNCLYYAVALFARKVEVRKVAVNGLICYFGNFVGSVTVAYFLAYLARLSNAGTPAHDYVIAVATKKMSYGWGEAVLRGVGANWLVCLALWLGICGNELAGKLIGIYLPVFSFVLLGWEHSVANMCTVMLGIFEGTQHNFGDFLAWNLIPVTLGNILGAVAFVAGTQFAVFGKHMKDELNLMGPPTADSALPSAANNGAPPVGTGPTAGYESVATNKAAADVAHSV